MRELLPKLEWFCKAVAPELQPYPLYVLSAADLPHGMADSRRFDGLTFGGADLTYREHVVGGWRGRGPVVVLAVDVIESWEAALPVVLHEVAHILERDEPFCGPVPFDGSPAALMFLAIAAASQADEPTATDAPPWLNHRWPFVRNVCHLAYRAQQRGENFQAGAIFAGPNYGISSGWFYARAIADEPARLQSETFTRIRAGPPPPEFMQLWNEDVSLYLESQSNEQGERTC